jgi:hypothetical protein
MESYDPRKPIIKATEDEMDDVQGHFKPARGTEEPIERRYRATEGSDENDEVDPEVEGHRGFHAR